jgi:hypothetical protein
MDYGNKSNVELGSADSIRLIRGKLIVELGEASFMRKTDDLQFKSFVSEVTDSFIDKYQKGATELPRTASFIITSNEDKFMRGLNGNRRMTPIPIYSIDFDFLNDTDTMPKLYAYYLRKAEKIIASDTVSDIRESGEMQRFFDASREQAINYCIHGDYIMDAIHEIEIEQLKIVSETKFSAGKPKKFSIFTNRMVHDKLIDARLQATPDIMNKIASIAVRLGYEKTKSIKIDEKVTSGYKMSVFVDEERKIVNEILHSRHDKAIISDCINPY